MTPFLFGVVVVLTATFAFLNGFRDVSVAVAVAARTRALTPSVAVLLAAFFNLLGALLSASLAVAASQAWISLPRGPEGLGILVASLGSAVVWGIILWRRGIPASSTHALVGGFAGAGIASLILGGQGVGGVDHSLLVQVILPLLLSPVVAYAGAFLLVYPFTWAARHTQPSVVNQRFRRSQAIAAGSVAFGHGLQDGQRISAVLLLALIAAGYSDGGTIPLWIVLLTAIMITIGTLFGGWRISQTVGHRMTRVDPLRGSVAQIYSALMLFVGAIGLQWPLSSTHTVTAAVLGAGSNQSFAVTNRRLVIRILGLWLLTPIATAALAFILALAATPLEI
ncbi:Low-affinity inorganic phosphate transporter 1 [Arthrobacter ulcerisalmonis]|uniref:Low-affinity inorganic phosphate transporter 1 n=1 Tax=Arthrobacter ulcerisalmonis TaxID=2483813 RepID=A0A3P5WEY1_9MICC|nr:inorganic phosphate transporter [Arthrobacter ulcerisalmonis]VDC18417.1 Low-affinity inorganic phosphate transporter 1 [Arthrobacter ulcerisalmonis]